MNTPLQPTIEYLESWYKTLPIDFRLPQGKHRCYSCPVSTWALTQGNWPRPATMKYTIEQVEPPMHCGLDSKVSTFVRYFDTLTDSFTDLYDDVNARQHIRAALDYVKDYYCL